MLKSLFIKFTIFFTSLFLFIAALEAGLRLMGFAVTHFRTNKEYELTVARENDVTILAMGDSFTYAGNISYEGSYPYQLYKLQYDDTKAKIKSFNIFNLGHCGTNTTDITQMLYNGIKEVKPDLVLLLAGAGDRYNFAGLNDEYQSNTSFFREKIFNETDLKKTFEEKFSFDYRNFRVYKMAQIFYLSAKKLYLKSVSQYDLDHGTESQRRENLANVMQAHQYLRSGNKEAAQLTLNKIPEKHRRSVNLDTLQNFSNISKKKRKDYLHLTHSLYYQLIAKNRHSDCVKLALNILKKDPHLFAGGIHFSFFLERLAYHSNFQSKIGFNQILDVLQHMSISKMDADQKNKLLRYVDFFKNKKAVQKKLIKNMEKNLNIMISMIKKNNVVPVILNYPFTYSYENKFIEKVAKENNVFFIDTYSCISKIRKEHTKKSLIEDDEHFTILGYHHMAKCVYERLKEVPFMKKQ